MTDVTILGKDKMMSIRFVYMKSIKIHWGHSEHVRSAPAVVFSVVQPTMNAVADELIAVLS